MTGVVLVLTVIALCASTWRITRLLIKDDLPIVKRPRDAIVARASRGLESGHLRVYGELVTCSWCVSVWVAAGVTAATDIMVGLPAPVLMFGLAAAFAATYEDLTTRTARPDINVQQVVMDALKDPAWQRYAETVIHDDSIVKPHLPRRMG